MATSGLTLQVRVSGKPRPGDACPAFDRLQWLTSAWHPHIGIALSAEQASPQGQSTIMPAALRQARAPDLT